MSTPREDDALFAELAEAMRGLGAVPGADDLAAAEAARARLDVDGPEQVAELAYDSWHDDRAGERVLVRDGAPDGARRLTFYGDETTLHVTSTVDALWCRLDPPDGAQVTLVTADGEQHPLTGVSEFELAGPPPGLVRLQSVSPAERLVTPWFRL